MNDHAGECRDDLVSILKQENAQLIELCRLAIDNIDPYTVQMQADLEYITEGLERLDHG